MSLFREFIGFSIMQGRGDKVVNIHKKEIDGFLDTNDTNNLRREWLENED